MRTKSEIPNPKSEINSDLPPFVKSWNQFYILLILWLIFLIGSFYAFTKYFE